MIGSPLGSNSIGSWLYLQYHHEFPPIGQALSTSTQLLVTPKIELPLLQSWGHLTVLVIRLYRWVGLLIAPLPWQLA